MTFGEKLKNARIEAGLKQSELAERLYTTSNTISNWENNVSKPDIDKLSCLCGVLHVNASYFLQANTPEDEVSVTELSIIKRYRTLDDHGKKHVGEVLNWETERMEILNEKISQLAAQNKHMNELKRTSFPRRFITYYHRLASAGGGEYLFDSLPLDTIEVPENTISNKADFVIGVNGDSMEPTYYDGQKVYVQKAAEISEGEIGIFIKGSECFIKEAGNGCLKSHNKKYPDIYPEEDIRLVGRVLGEVKD